MLRSSESRHAGERHGRARRSGVARRTAVGARHRPPVRCEDHGEEAHCDVVHHRVRRRGRAPGWRTVAPSRTTRASVACRALRRGTVTTRPAGASGSRTGAASVSTGAAAARRRPTWSLWTAGVRGSTVVRHRHSSLSPKMRRTPPKGRSCLRNPAASYSPRGSTPKYHRRWQS